MTTDNPAPAPADTAVPAGGPLISDVPPNPINPPIDPNNLTPQQKFIQMLPEDLRNEPTFLKYQNEAEAFRGLYNAAKLVGADKNTLLKIPSTEDAPEWNDVYSKLGRPESPDKYGSMEKFKESPYVDGNSLKSIAETAHKLGVSGKAFDAIVEGYAQSMEAATQQQQAALQDQLKNWHASVREEYGIAYETKMARAETFLKTQAPESVKDMIFANPQIFQHPEFIKFFTSIAEKTTEDSGMPRGTGSSNAPLTPDEARMKIKEFEMDRETQKVLLNPMDPRREDYLAQRQRLYEYAYPQQQTGAR